MSAIQHPQQLIPVLYTKVVKPGEVLTCSPVDETLERPARKEKYGLCFASFNMGPFSLKTICAAKDLRLFTLSEAVRG